MSHSLFSKRQLTAFGRPDAANRRHCWGWPQTCPHPALVSSRHGTPRVLPLPGAWPLVSTPLGHIPASHQAQVSALLGWDVLWAEDGGARRPGVSGTISRADETERKRQLRGAWGLLSRWVPWDTPQRRRRGTCSQTSLSTC